MKHSILFEFESVSDSAAFLAKLQTLDGYIVEQPAEYDPIIPNTTEMLPVEEIDEDEQRHIDELKQSIKETFTAPNGDEPIELKFNLEDIQTIAKEKSDLYGRDKVVAVIANFGGKLKDVPATKYNDLALALEGIGDD